MSSVVKAILIMVGLAMAFFFILVLTFIFSGISYYNKEVALRSLHESQEDNNKIVFEKFKKVIIEKGGVAQANADTMKDLYKVIMSSKSQSSGALLSFIHQHNPNPDASLTETTKQFKDIMSSIEGLREEFSRAQRKSRDVEREHTVLIKGFPSRFMIGLFGGNLEPLHTQIIVSDEVAETFNSGRDNNPVDPFNKLKK